MWLPDVKYLKPGCPVPSEFENSCPQGNQCQKCGCPVLKSGCPVSSEFESSCPQGNQCQTCGCPGLKHGCPVSSEKNKLTQNCLLKFLADPEHSDQFQIGCPAPPPPPPPKKKKKKKKNPTSSHPLSKSDLDFGCPVGFSGCPWLLEHSKS